MKLSTPKELRVEKIVRWSVFIAFLIIGIFILIVTIDNKRVKQNYSATLRDLQTENRRLEKLIGDSTATIGRVSDAIVVATESINTIDSGIGNSINAIEESIRIAEELFGLINYIARAIEEYESDLSP